MSQNRRKNSLKNSHELLMAISNELKEIQKENERTWAFIEVNDTLTKELRNSLDELLSKQEESLKKLGRLSKSEVPISSLNLVAAARAQ